MTMVGLESTVLLTFLVAMALLLAYSGVFLWLNRDRPVMSILTTSAWCLAGLFVLVVTSTDSASYWIVALAVLGLVLGTGTLASVLRRRFLKIRVRARSSQDR